MGKLLNILLVEDDRSDAELICRELLKANIVFAKMLVENREDYLRGLANFNPDIIISDYRLPRFNGEQALELRNSISPLTPFILVTGSINEEIAVECMKAGATDYVIKDHIMRLGTAVLNALEQKEVKMQKKLAEELLIKSEGKFRNLFQNHGAVKLIFDPISGNILEANNAAADFYGWTVEELTTMHISEIVVQLAGKGKSKMDSARGLIKSHYESQHFNSKHQIFDVEIFSSRIDIDGKEFVHEIVHDISEKKRAEESIKLLGRSVEQSSVSIMITDSKGTIKYINQFASKISGYSFEETIGRNARFMKSGLQGKEFYQTLWTTILSGKVWEGEFRNVKKNGEIFCEKAVISPVLNKQNEITHFVAVKEDVTERNRMIEELVAAKLKAEECDRLKTAFINNISHEIRTPLNGILGFGHLLSEINITKEERNRYVRTLQRSSDRLLQTVSDYLSIATVVSGQVKVHIEKFRLNDLLDEIEEVTLTRCREKNLESELILPVELNNFTFCSDKALLSDILKILVNNAVKFTKKGKVSLGVVVSEGILEVCVSDTGKGIGQQQLQSIFDVFMQVDSSNTRSYEGSGLGLAIAKGYADLIGATLSVTSSLGKGSKFFLRVLENDTNKN
ncbi:MAG: PAS domain S-box protein [Prolixibacteraceae bacterium]